MFGIEDWKVFAEADSTTNSFVAGTIGGFRSCVNRNSCLAFTDDKGDTSYEDPWYWTYHANTLTALGANDCTGIDYSGKTPSEPFKADAYNKCLNSVRTSLLWKDRKAVNCLT